MKKLVLLLSAVLALGLPSFTQAQNDGQEVEEKVLCKNGKTSLVQTDEGYFMSVYDKGEKEYLTCFLGADRKEAAASVRCIQDWFNGTAHRDYQENCKPCSPHGHHAGAHHGHRTSDCPVTFYHGYKHCFVSEGNGEFCRRYVSRTEKDKEFLLARIGKKFLGKAYEVLTEEQ